MSDTPDDKAPGAIPRPTKRRFSMEPPQVEPAMATRIGSGQYWGCPEISGVVVAQKDYQVTVVLGLNLQHSRGWQVIEEHAPFNFQLHDIAIHFIAEVAMGPE